MTDREFQEFMIKHITELSSDVKELRQSQARMEFQQGEKLAALFDGYQSIKENLVDHTERMQRIEDKLETHDIKIQVLDKTKSNKRKIK